MEEGVEYVRTFDFELSGYPDETFRVVLDSVTYELRFVWNERDESWQFSLGDIGAEPTITTKLTCYTNLLAPYRYLDNVPNGNIFIFPLREVYNRVGRYDIGPLKGIQMAYASRAEDIEAEE